MNPRFFFLAPLTILLYACTDAELLPHTDAAANGTAAIPEKEKPLLRDTSFVPDGYHIMEAVYGDLNLDSFPDAVVVMRHASDRAGSYSDIPRWVYVLTGNSDGTYTVRAKNKHATYAQEGGQLFGEPFNGIETEHGRFTIKHYGGSRYRWTSDYVFAYDAQKADWHYVQHSSSEMDMLQEDTVVHLAVQAIQKKIAFSSFDYRTESR